MYRALVERDAGYEGIFFVAVKTTGVFCRPTCAARKPRPENVEYFPDTREAILAGYRPCRRCRPLESNGEAPEWVSRLLERVEQDPAGRVTDSDLRAMSIDPARARRYFKTRYGMTFHAYHRARRMGLALNEIRDGGDLTVVGYRHGFESTSGFRETFTRLFGRTPGASRDLPCLFARWMDTPLGPMLGVAGDSGLSMLDFVDRGTLESRIEVLRRRLRCSIVPGTCDALDQTFGELREYFDEERTRFDVTLDPHGTPFQRAVWEKLLEIPYGQTTSYSRIASAAGRPGANRAVGQANNANPLAIIVPCHRVVRADGSMCGYGGGLWRKKWLLEHEAKTISHGQASLAHGTQKPTPAHTPGGMGKLCSKTTAASSAAGGLPVSDGGVGPL
jgi:AraC family transcriptional regulator of adaptative response/methylated-DNA-[protein]-cysteine methyltransferase